MTPLQGAEHVATSLNRHGHAHAGFALCKLPSMRVDAQRGDLELVLQPDIARRLGLTRQRVHQLAQETGFPVPVGRLGRSHVWDWSIIEAWAHQRERPILRMD